MPVTLDWLGCATFRLTIDDLVLFLDAYIDRVPSAPPVGLTAAEVETADYVLIGHSHFDHIAGAEVIAANTGARVIGSNESVHVLSRAGVPDAQLIRSQGGERHRLSQDVTVQVFPSLHSCIWVGGSWDPAKVVLGHYGLCEDERWTGDAAIGEAPDDPDPLALEQMNEHRSQTIGSHTDGGALAYLIDTPYGTIFFHDTSGAWTGVTQDLRPDFAIVAMAGRGNVDGEPIQGSLSQFVGRMAGLLRPPRMTLGHHDDWMPPFTRDMTSADAMAPVRSELARVAPRTNLIELDYLDGFVVFE